MKKTLLLLVTVLFTAGNNYAQSSYKFNIGESIQEPSMGISVSAGQDDENIFLVGFKPGLFSAVKYWFHSYNPKTLQQKAVVFQKMWADQFDGNYYFAADMMNDEPCMFTYEKVKGGVAINYYTFDKSTMAPSGKNMLVTIPGISVEMNQTTFVQEITEKVRPPQPDYSFTNMAYINFGISSPKYDQVMYVRSADKKTFYIVSLYDNGEQNANNSLAAVNVYAYDNSKTLLWTKSGKIPFDKWQSSIDGVDADNIGNVYFIIKNHHKKLRGESKGDNTPNYDYKLYYINKDKDDLQSVKLGTGDKFITSLTVKVYDDSVGAVCGGFYYDDNSLRKKDKVTGCFLSVIDNQTGEALDNDFYDFDDRIFEGTVGYKQIIDSEKDSPVNDLALENIYTRPDGSILIVGERLTYIPMTTTYKQSYGNVTNTRSRTDYARDFKDIVVTSIAPGGETEWSVRIPKFQRAPYTSFEASFVPVLCGNDFYMVYNDNLSNLKLVEEGSFASLDYTEANSGLFIVKIDADGNVEKDLLSSYKDVGGSFCLQGSVMLNNNKLLIPVTKMLKGTVKYAEVDFKPSKQ